MLTMALRTGFLSFMFPQCTSFCLVVSRSRYVPGSPDPHACENPVVNSRFVRVVPTSGPGSCVKSCWASPTRAVMVSYSLSRSPDR